MCSRLGSGRQSNAEKSEVLYLTFSNVRARRSRSGVKPEPSADFDPHRSADFGKLWRQVGRGWGYLRISRLVLTCSG